MALPVDHEYDYLTLCSPRHALNFHTLRFVEFFSPFHNFHENCTPLLSHFRICWLLFYSVQFFTDHNNVDEGADDGVAT